MRGVLPALCVKGVCKHRKPRKPRKPPTPAWAPTRSQRHNRRSGGIMFYVFAMNRKTANALGLTIPPFLLSRTDKVFE